MRAACGEAHLKTIIATGELATMTNVYKASLVCMMAGADFVKVCTLPLFASTSTARALL
jgi:deoxyribose-phosphate aldolase